MQRTLVQRHQAACADHRRQCIVDRVPSRDNGLRGLVRSRQVTAMGCQGRDAAVTIV